MMRKTDLFVKEFQKNYHKDEFLRLQVVRNKVRSTITMYLERSSGKMVCCKKSSKIFDMKMVTSQELNQFMKAAMNDLPIETYTVDSVG